jgi:tripartite-type tricarboxylate transporter receptor subunit TctC
MRLATDATGRRAATVLLAACARWAGNFILSCAALATVAWPGPASAQGPGQMRIVAATPAGASLDATARLIALHLSERLGEPVVVENRPGAANAIGTEYVAHSAPDGRTLLIGAVATVLTPLLYKVDYDLFRDLKPVIQVSRELFLLVVRSDLPANTPGDLAKLAKEKPGGLNCAGAPGMSTMGCEQLRLQFGGNITTVPFPGVAPAVTALLGSHVDIMFVTIGDVLGSIRTGRLRAIANASESRVESPFPELPLLADRWPGFTLTGMYGILVPAATPPETIAMLNRELNAVLATPAFRERLIAGWQVPVGGTPERYGEALRNRHDQLQRVIRAAGLSGK